MHHIEHISFKKRTTEQVCTHTKLSDTVEEHGTGRLGLECYLNDQKIGNR